MNKFLFIIYSLKLYESKKMLAFSVDSLWEKGLVFAVLLTLLELRKSGKDSVFI